MTTRIAYIVSAHGLGHAARSAAVLNALADLRPDVVPRIFSTVPEWFWEDSLSGAYELHRTVTDVGMVQVSPIEEDPAATLRELDKLRPLPEAGQSLAEELRRLGCRLAVCDISPLGLAAAKRAGIPSVLIESFTWDWIYAAYFDAEPGLRAVAAEMATIFDGADLRIQTEPVSRPLEGALAVPPVYRRARSNAATVRTQLGLEGERPLVLITMGGASWPFGFLDLLTGAKRMCFVAFSGTAGIERCENLVLLPDRSPVFMPDLVAASDVIVGKLGYSTACEAWAAGTRYAYVPRRTFPETASLAGFVAAHLPRAELDQETFFAGGWLEAVTRLLETPRAPRRTDNGADRIAAQLATRL